MEHTLLVAHSINKQYEEMRHGLIIKLKLVKDDAKKKLLEYDIKFDIQHPVHDSDPNT